MSQRVVWVIIGGILGAMPGAVLGGFLLSNAAPGPGEGGDKFGANVMASGLAGVVLGGIAGLVVGGTLGSFLGKRRGGPSDNDSPRPQG